VRDLTATRKAMRLSAQLSGTPTGVNIRRLRPDSVGRLLCNFLAMIAESELGLIRMRTREGMKVASGTFPDKSILSGERAGQGRFGGLGSVLPMVSVWVRVGRG
jgi:hypothetical protein